jgi:hypothetical protein
MVFSLRFFLASVLVSGAIVVSYSAFASPQDDKDNSFNNLDGDDSTRGSNVDLSASDNQGWGGNEKEPFGSLSDLSARTADALANSDGDFGSAPPQRAVPNSGSRNLVIGGGSIMNSDTLFGDSSSSLFGTPPEPREKEEERDDSRRSASGDPEETENKAPFHSPTKNDPFTRSRDELLLHNDSSASQHRSSSQSRVEESDLSELSNFVGDNDASSNDTTSRSNAPSVLE